jgi:putative redox protein
MSSSRIETVQAEWIDAGKFLLKDHFGFPILMTQPDGVNGADLLPLSLIGCAAWDVIAILKKQRQQVTRFQVTAESERDPDPPWRFRRIHILYHIAGSDLNLDMIRRAIHLAETKYCSTYATLQDALELSSDFEIEEM